MIQYVRTPWFIRMWYPSLIWEKESDNSIYLTFDDGPHPEVTKWVIEQLSTVNAKATFFCIGEQLEQYPEIAKDLIKKGHRLGNHTFSHLKGWKSSLEDYLLDIERAEILINELNGDKKKLFRPPYGRIKRSQIQSLNDQYEMIMWSHLTWDFSSVLDCNQIIIKLKKAKPGSILVFHDSEKAYENLKKILPEMLSFYSGKGFNFKTL